MFERFKVIKIGIFITGTVLLSSAFLYTPLWRDTNPPLHNELRLPKHSTVIDCVMRLHVQKPLSFPLLTAAQLAWYSFWYKKPLCPGIYDISALSLLNVTQLYHYFSTPKPSKLTIPEGLSVSQILHLLYQNSYLIGIVWPAPPEGFLMPDTYYIDPFDKRGQVVKRMQDAMHQYTHKHFEGHIITSVDEWISLAAIIEKETALSEEKPRIAGVFLNRLQKNMPLQADPTVVYGITGGKTPLNRLLTRRDTQTPTPYNTYTRKGIPQPIACPGRKALQAVMNPVMSDDLYFVANGKGGHFFAATLAAHNRNRKNH